jgi:uncharacterized membrane protein
LSKRQYEWVKAHSIQTTLYFGLAFAIVFGGYERLRHPDADIALIAALALVVGFAFGAVNVLLIRRNYPVHPNRRSSRKDRRERERRADW